MTQSPPVMKSKHLPALVCVYLSAFILSPAHAQQSFLKKWQTSLPDFFTEVAAAAEASAKSDAPSNLGALRTRLGSAMRQFESQPVQWEITFQRADQADSLINFNEAGKEKIMWHDEGGKPANPNDKGANRYEKGLVGFFVSNDAQLHNAFSTKELMHIRIYADRRAFATFKSKPANTKMTLKGRVQKITGLPVMYDDKKSPKALSKGYLHRWILSVEVVSAVPTS